MDRPHQYIMLPCPARERERERERERQENYSDAVDSTTVGKMSSVESSG